MINALEFIFSSFWVWFGFNILILSTGWALAMPFYWWYKVKQFKILKKGYWNLMGQ